RGARHTFQRRRNDGRVISTVGGPMPGGGYVMCFTDVTGEANALAELETARIELENRVERRTAELRAANAALARATEEKTRFLAAASHDLLQPLHAARLFTAALSEEVEWPARGLVGNVERSIEAADALLKALLDISRLDAGGVTPRPARFDLSLLAQDLGVIFAPLAAEKGLSLRMVAPSVWVETDRALLRSILQNFISNAVRYTSSGGVLLALRPRGDSVRVEVYDTGVGIDEAHQTVIFREFERLGTSGEAGVGLGLAIVERTARLLGLSVDVRSRPGRGSRFALTLPRIIPEDVSASETLISQGQSVRTVLVVDDEPAVRQAMAALLQQWGCRVLPAAGMQEALSLAGEADCGLIDFNLGQGEDGLNLIGRLRQSRPELRVALITADRSPATETACEAQHIALFAKPADPKILRQWLGA
ncbi:MAG: ATP-binding protein, partial [Asticcacaulis sp.]